MDRFTFSTVCAMTGLSCLASADVVTGVYPTEYLEFSKPGPSALIEDIGIEFSASIFGAGGGSNTSNHLFSGYTNVLANRVYMLSSGNESEEAYSTQFFNEGQSLAAYRSAQNSISLGLTTDDHIFGSTIESMGVEGQVLYFGFTLQAPVGDSFEYNFGFIQLVKGEGHLDFEVVGWAYETQAGVDLVTYDLVPAPSGTVVLAFAALGVTRRRRI